MKTKPYHQILTRTVKLTPISYYAVHFKSNLLAYNIRLKFIIYKQANLQPTDEWTTFSSTFQPVGVATLRWGDGKKKMCFCRVFISEKQWWISGECLLVASDFIFMKDLLEIRNQSCEVFSVCSGLVVWIYFVFDDNSILMYFCSWLYGYSVGKGGIIL